jgi:hypothetical protein
MLVQAVSLVMMSTPFLTSPLNSWVVHAAVKVHSESMTLRSLLPGIHPLTAPVHPPEGVKGFLVLHHVEGRYS